MLYGFKILPARAGSDGNPYSLFVRIFYIEYLFNLYYVITFGKVPGHLSDNVLPMNPSGRYGWEIH